MVGHEQGDVQQVIIQLQIVQREPDTEFHIISVHFLIFFETLTSDIIFSLDFQRENIIVPLDNKVYLIRRIVLRPISIRCR